MNKKNIHKTKKISRIYYFDWLRILSSFSVILIHVSAYYYNRFNINSYIWKISFYYNGISRCGVPNFFMISGSLFLNKELTIGKIFNTYIKNIFIHLFIWSSIYSLFNIKFSKKNIEEIILKIIIGHYHQWYLFAIIRLYCIIPFLKEITKKEKILQNFIFLSFIILFIIPNYIYIFLYFSKKIYYFLNILKKQLNFCFFNLNIFYFVYGYIFSLHIFIN